MTVSPRTPVQSVQRIFPTNPTLSSVVVVEEDKPLGLVMGYSLDRHLATLYGRALYAEKAVSVLMDAAPMIADERAKRLAGIDAASDEVEAAVVAEEKALAERQKAAEELERQASGQAPARTTPDVDAGELPVPPKS